MIDTHVHFWRYSAREHGWIKPQMRVLQRDHLPSDLEPLLRENGIEGCIAVQALHSRAETIWLLDLARAHAWIAGVVGWVDLLAHDIEAQLEELAAHPKLVGVRHLAQDEEDPRFLARADVVRGIGKLAQHGLAFDLLVREREMPAAIELARCLPNQTFVLDHLGKPPIRAGRVEPWRGLLRELGRCDNVVAKVSGLMTERARHGPPHDDLAPYLDAVVEAFGGDRLMPGSDWPVCLLAGEYAAGLDVVRSNTAIGDGSRARERAYGV